jgi:hypothetical protein
MYPHVKFASRNTAERIIVRIRHPMDVPLVMASMQAEKINLQTATTVEEAMATLNAPIYEQANTDEKYDRPS